MKGVIPRCPNCRKIVRKELNSAPVGATVLQCDKCGASFKLGTSEDR